MKMLLVIATAAAVIFGLTRLRSQQRGEDVWHEVTNR